MIANIDNNWMGIECRERTERPYESVPHWETSYVFDVIAIETMTCVTAAPTSYDPVPAFNSAGQLHLSGFDLAGFLHP